VGRHHDNEGRYEVTLLYGTVRPWLEMHRIGAKARKTKATEANEADEADEARNR
jgi:hypothetical protein